MQTEFHLPGACYMKEGLPVPTTLRILSGICKLYGAFFRMKYILGGWYLVNFVPHTTLQAKKDLCARKACRATADNENLLLRLTACGQFFKASLLQHILNKNPIPSRRIIYKNVGHRAYQFAVLDDGTDRHADVK